MATDALAQFKTLMGEIQDLNTVQGLLGWDLETYMPPGGTETRSRQMSTLAKLAHQTLTSDEMGALIQTLEKKPAFGRLDRVAQAMVREASRLYTREKKIPVDLVQAMSETTAQAHPIWVAARKDNDFDAFAPVLKKIVTLNRRMADAIGYQDSPYDALLDLYEPGLTAKTLDRLFADLKAQLVPLVLAIQASPKKPDHTFLARRTFHPDKQWAFTMQVLTDMGFDFSRGRQDKAAHPFTMGMGPDDVRLTTRVFPKDIVSALFSSIHEGGHGLYEQGIDPSLARTFLDGGASLGIHESQSRMWENVVGRSLGFWKHYFPKLQALFPKALSEVTVRRFYQAINTVAPSLIRVEADEVTYNLHILLRYELEKDIIEGRCPVRDIPDRWHEAMAAYLGITPPTHALGALQDVHWSHGAFGYFPTYTLGNLYAVQFFNTACRQLPDMERRISRGNMLPLKTWLNAEVHRWSKVETPAEIVHRVTGEPLNAAYFIDYLWEKYADLYALKRPDLSANTKMRLK